MRRSLRCFGRGGGLLCGCAAQSIQRLRIGDNLSLRASGGQQEEGAQRSETRRWEKGALHYGQD